ncbi:MAG: glycosyltransferase, partial [Spirulinaceae cyanobacterium RM2_2_10]|nr:glycosyltransferase [Spirulinaceae cyanobacterium RM2_2_10]
MHWANLIGKWQKLRRLQRDRGWAGLLDFLRTRLRRQLGQGFAYRRWRAQRRWTPAAIARARAEIATWPTPPLISVLVPVYNVESRWLERAIRSVQAQIYPHWQLCIADAPRQPGVRSQLERLQAADPRLQVTFRAENGGIAAASNSALALATGAYIALLDHDDELAIDALYAIAQHLRQHPETDLIYSDEDCIDARGRRQRPQFKPDWSPDFLHSQMYLCHLSVYRTALVRDLGGFRSEYDGAQDYDLALRVTEKTPRIQHLPQVLYHWRQLPTSSAAGLAAKP